MMLPAMRQMKYPLRRCSSLVVVSLARAMALTCLLIPPFINVASADSVTGSAAAVDGDGLILFGIEHRLHGIDAVELDQGCTDHRKKAWLCGVRAKLLLESLVQGQRVTCEWTELDRFQRPLSTCSVNEINLNAAMVYAGYAVAYRRYSERYIEVEERARTNSSGIWSGEFLMPWEHRRTGKSVEIPAPDATRPIKGNINSKGKRYYHCPSDRSYANTRISEGRGERWFSTSGEAESAGWLRPPGYPACGF